MTKNLGRARLTEAINRRTTQSAFRAFDFAASLGRPLNLYVVIHLHEKASASAATLFERIRHKYRDWLSHKAKTMGRLGLAPAYVYVFENPAKNPHVNWVVHIPASLQAEFQRKLPRWVERAQGQLHENDIHCQPIELNRAKRLAKYILKGTDSAFVEHFHLQDVHKPQGSVWGKRAGISPSLGNTARNAVGFRPPRGRYAGLPLNGGVKGDG